MTTIRLKKKITIAITGNMISGPLRTDTDAKIRNVKLF